MVGSILEHSVKQADIRITLNNLYLLGIEDKIG